MTKSNERTNILAAFIRKHVKLRRKRKVRHLCRRTASQLEELRKYKAQLPGVDVESGYFPKMPAPRYVKNKLHCVARVFATCRVGGEVLFWSASAASKFVENYMLWLEMIRMNHMQIASCGGSG